MSENKNSLNKYNYIRYNFSLNGIIHIIIVTTLRMFRFDKPYEVVQ